MVSADATHVLKLPTCESDAATTAAAVWVVIPAFNEGRRLAATLARLARYNYRVVVVDDGSSDETWHAAAASCCWRLRHTINCGQGAALKTGIDFALQQGAELIVTFDADGQHSAADIAALVAPVRAGEVDVALGSRFLGTAIDLPRLRRFVLRAGVIFTRTVSKIRVTDTHNGLRLFAPRAASLLRLTHNRMAHASEILDEVRRLNLAYCEIPVTVRYTPETLAKGQSCWNLFGVIVPFLFGEVDTMTLLLWTALLAMSWHFYRRCVSLQRQITEIVRHEALRNAEAVEPALRIAADDEEEIAAAGETHSQARVA